MVVLSRLYTRTGDGGETRLSDMSLTSKTDPRVSAYGDVDEANAQLGVVLATPGLPEDVAEPLRLIQNELFDLGADLSNPLAADPEYPPLRIEQPSVDRLEAWCDQFSAGMPTLRSFILPGGCPAAAGLHVARTVTRRAERSAWIAAEAYGFETGTAERPGGVNRAAITYLNRLSDLLFAMIRYVNGPEGDILWIPGGERNPGQESAPTDRESDTPDQAPPGARTQEN